MRAGREEPMAVDIVRARGYAETLRGRSARSVGEDMANRTYAATIDALCDEVISLAARLRAAVEHSSCRCPPGASGGKHGRR